MHQPMAQKLRQEGKRKEPKKDFLNLIFSQNSKFSLCLIQSILSSNTTMLSVSGNQWFPEVTVLSGHSFITAII